MAYEKQTWVTGEVITAPKLNHMEDGIGSENGYDIVFTKTIDSSHGFPVNVLTADGASFEELLNGGERKAKIFVTPTLMLDDTEETYDKSVEFKKSSVNSVTSVQFAFVGDADVLGIRLIKLDSTGAYSDIFKDITGGSDTISGEYTYSDGHYVFTPSGQPE